MKKNFKDYLTEEDYIQKAIIDYINLQYKDVLFFHPANEGKRTPFEQFKIKWLGIRKGVSDLIFLEPRLNYYGLILEVKSDNGELTDEQLLFLQEAKKRKYYAEVVYNSNEGIKIIDWYFKTSMNLRNIIIRWF